MKEHTVEYRYLEDTYEKGGIQVTVVYGMNQVGKSFLFKKFVLSHEGIFFSSKPGSAKEIRRCFANHVGLNESKDEEAFSYEMIFSHIFSDVDKKHVLIIDDFHNIIRNDVDFFPTLCQYMEKNLENCLIYLVSSHIGWVENQMISKIGKQTKSITGFLKMKEMSFEECCSYFRTYSTYDSLTMYSILGGQQGYLDCMDQGNSTIENICNIILSSHSYIFARMHQYIEEQLRETSVYYTILVALAKGNCKLNDIYHYTGFSRAKISVYLKCLMELEFVEKVFSIDTPGKINVQKGVYRIVNPIILFYFKFIYPNESNFKLQKSFDFYNIYISEELKQVIFNKFDVICRTMFVNMNEDKDLPFLCSTIGEWVGKKGTIPVVAKNEVEKYLVGFCNHEEVKYSFYEYKNQVVLLNEAKIEAEYIYLFSFFNCF
jgi:AAA+ ATPase superfamily predicted ATPase